MKPMIFSFDLIWHLVRRDFILRYKGSVIGILWSLLVPLAQLLVLVFVFQKVIHLDIDAYAAFVFTALLPWNWFSSCLSSASSLFLNNQDLVRRPNFTPSVIIPINMMSNLLNYILFLPILFIILFFYDRNITLSIIALPLLILIQGILTAGLSLIVATMNVFYRDVQHIVSVLLMLLFYMTPIFYQFQAIGDKYRLLLLLNPIAVLIQAYRAIFFYGMSPDWNSLLLAGTISIITCTIGYFIYQRQLHNIIDAL